MAEADRGRRRPWRRARVRQVPAEQWRWVREQHPILTRLTAAEDARLKELVERFLRRQRFEARGLPVDEAVYRLVVATQACVPILGLGFEWCRGWRTVVLVPRAFASEMEETDAGGVVREWQEESGRRGVDEGPIVLSWKMWNSRVGGMAATW